MVPDYMGRTAKSIAFNFCPAWGTAKATALRATCFQFTLLCGGRHEGQIIKQYNNLFQFTPPRGGGRRWMRPQDEQEKGISIHAPARGATPQINADTGKWQFQFTPPRGGRR